MAIGQSGSALSRVELDKYVAHGKALIQMDAFLLSFAVIFVAELG